MPTGCILIRNYIQREIPYNHFQAFFTSPLLLIGTLQFKIVGGGGATDNLNINEQGLKIKSGGGRVSENCSGLRVATCYD